MILNQAYRIVSIILASLIFFSSTGISMNLHYCQGHLRSISILPKSECCSTETKKEYCQKHVTQSVTVDTCSSNDGGKKCCHNEKLQVKSLDQDLLLVKLSQREFSFPQIAVATVEIIAFSEVSFDDLLITHFDQYKPPLPKGDIQVLFQTFLL